MNRHSNRHLSAEELAEWGSGRMSDLQKIIFQPHLDACAECRESLQALQTEWIEYLDYHDNALKPSIPDPPLPWRPLDRDADPGVTPLTGRESRWRGAYRWGAIAATIVIAVAALRIFQQPDSVRAAELLQKASNFEVSASEKQARIRIVARGRSWVRPASLPESRRSQESDIDRGLRHKFEAAHYDWRDPLSARSFSAWRDRLPEKRDEVTKLKNSDSTGGIYRIRTRTSSGNLTQATLSLREKDLHPLSGELQFRDELVELNELPPGPIDQPDIDLRPAPERQPVSARPEVQPVGPAEELRVLAALHAIGADLGEDITVTRQSDSIAVTGFGLDANREQRVKEAVAGIPSATFQVDRADEPRARQQTRAVPAPQESGRISALRSELETKLNDRTSVQELVDQLLEASDNVLARAFAIRSLATRFPPSAEAQLSAPDKALLTSLRRDHLQVLSQELDRMMRRMEPVFVEAVPPQPALPQASQEWQAAAEGLLNQSRHLDQLLNRAFAGSGDGSLTEVRLALLGLRRAVASFPVERRQ